MNNDGYSDLIVFRNGTWFVNYSQAGEFLGGGEFSDDLWRAGGGYSAGTAGSIGWDRGSEAVYRQQTVVY